MWHVTPEENMDGDFPPPSINRGMCAYGAVFLHCDAEKADAKTQRKEEREEVREPLSLSFPLLFLLAQCDDRYSST
jgi:hypothetical protein